MSHVPNQPPAASPADSVLERNLRALKRASPDLVDLLRETRSRADLVWAPSDEGPTASVGSPPVQLASRRRPADEGTRLCATVDISQAAAVVVVGFGLGYHVAALAKRMLRRGLVLVFEPDLGLLKAVLERIDYSDAFAESNVAIYHDPSDGARIAASLTGVEGVVAVGAKIVVHPPSRARLGQAAEAFATTFAEVLKALRTNVVTTLLQVDVTLRNLFQNLDRYVTVPGIRDLKNAARSKPAVVVSAGPSLERNIRLLGEPGVRDRVVIIATQTVLRTLLRRGIKPHFVTALDYHEISARFYEGLTERDVDGVTLVAEPKANPAILDAFPGAIRCTREPVLDELIGPGLRRDMGQLSPGSTVAHLCYYLARHLGCDPVILVGQDLGFTDGQYYASGAAIHDVWASELSEFNTLEMLEWQRIARFGRLLRNRTDTLGRHIYTDEQMSTYLVQFEREFAADTKKGLKVIDATEGGVAKAYTTSMSLADALREFASGEPFRLPGTERTPFTAACRKETVARRVEDVREDVDRLSELCAKSREHLQAMLANLDDQKEVNRRITEVYKLRTRALELGTAHWIVQYLNQTGTLNRFRADRTLHLDESLSPIERQRRQIERDLVNVRWLHDASKHMEQMLDDAVRTLGGGPRVTRDPPPSPEALEALREEFPDLAVPDTRRRKVAICITFDPELGGLGVPRSLGEPLIGSSNALRCTLRRLAGSREADEIILLATDPDAARGLAGAALSPASGPPVRVFGVDRASVRDRLRAVGTARLWSRACWRGGIANLTEWDEAFVPAAAASVIDDAALDAIAVVGADWALIDPRVVDEVIARYRERPESYKVTFAPAPPGLGCCVVASPIVRDLAAQAHGAGPFASVGGLIGYIPIAPQLDPLGRPMCVQIPPVVRDLSERLVADCAGGNMLISRIAERLGPRVWEADAAEIAQVASALARTRACPPSIVRIGLTGRGSLQDPAVLEGVFEQIASWATPVAVSIEGDPTESPAPLADALAHPAWREIARAARRVAAAVHVRTRLPVGCGAEVLACGADVVSVDLDSDSARTCEELTGRTDHAERSAQLRDIIGRRRAGPGAIALPWIVPRITRRDAVYEEIEPFYAGWLMDAGAAVIDPLRAAIPGERISPIALPTTAREKKAASEVVIAADGTALAYDESTGRLFPLGPIGVKPLAELWADRRNADQETPVLRVLTGSPQIARAG